MHNAFMIKNNKCNLRNFNVCILQIRELQNTGLKPSRKEDLKYGT